MEVWRSRRPDARTIVGEFETGVENVGTVNSAIDHRNFE